MAHAHGVRQAAEEQYNALSDLAGWLAGVKSRDAALKAGGGDGGAATSPPPPPLPPVRHVAQTAAQPDAVAAGSPPAPLEPSGASPPPPGPHTTTAGASSEALRAHGNALYKSGDHAGAADAYSAALAAAREAGDDAAAALALGNRAQARLAIKAHAAAAQDCTAALRLDAVAGSAKLWMRRAAALNAVGRHGAAAGDLRVASLLLQNSTSSAAAAAFAQAEAGRELVRTEVLCAAAASRAPPQPQLPIDIYRI